jgi:hypothetical protein
MDKLTFFRAGKWVFGAMEKLKTVFEWALSAK